MKKWIVTCRITDHVVNGINYPRVQDDVVEADYVKLDGEALIFRRTVRNGYPELVQAYAPGRWLEVREKN